VLRGSSHWLHDRRGCLPMIDPMQWFIALIFACAMLLYNLSMGEP